MYTTKNLIPGKTLEEKEEALLKVYKPLIIKGFSLTEYDDCLEDFIYNFLVLYNSKYYTAACDNIDVNQCKPGAHRSLIDLFLISKHYFPQCTLKEVKEALLFSNYGTQICSTIHRRVYESTIKYPTFTNHHLDIRDEFNYTLEELIKA